MVNIGHSESLKVLGVAFPKLDDENESLLSSAREAEALRVVGTIKIGLRRALLQLDKDCLCCKEGPILHRK
jgi:hypothetical protein